MPTAQVTETGLPVPSARKVSSAEVPSVCLAKLSAIGGNVIQVSESSGAHVSEALVTQGVGNQ
jgi:hypothetical protein